MHHVRKALVGQDVALGCNHGSEFIEQISLFDCPGVGGQ
jgi:hypothetical protein